MKTTTAALEAVLFVTPRPLSLTQLSTILDIAEEDVLGLIEEYEKILKGRGVRLLRHNDTFQLVTDQKFGELVASIVAEEAPNLSAPALEVLAIIAYQQPIGRAQIDEIRGVGSDQTIRGLLGRELIAEVTTNQKSTGILYVTTPHFLQALGMLSLDELKPFDEQKV